MHEGNLDPGGFSLLLGLWFKIDTAPEWARTLPLVFHAMGMAGLAGLGWILRRNWVFAAFCSLVPAAFPLLLHEGSELRAYSMEFAGIAIGCTLLTRLAARPSISAAITSAFVIGFFLTSRYAYFLFAGSASIALALVLPCCTSRGLAAQCARIVGLCVVSDCYRGARTD